MNPVLRDYLQTAMLLSLPCLPLLVFGYATAGWLGITATALIWIFIVVVTYVCAIPAILKRHRAEYIAEIQAPGLYGLTVELARRAAVPTPALYLMPDATPQLFVASVSTRRGTIALSKGLFQILNRDELAAVVAHAITKLRWGGVISATVAAGLLQLMIAVGKSLRLNRFASKPSATAENNDVLQKKFGCVLGAIAATLIRLATCPARQFEVDEASVQLLGDDDPLRTALCKLEAFKAVNPLATASVATGHLFICNPLPRGRWARVFATHPPLKQRIQRLEALWRRPVSVVAFR